ncbi:MAG: MAPEG family protein [Arenibacterium sp.]
MEQFAEYSHATATLAIWGLWMIALSIMSTSGKTPRDRAECGKPKRDYSNEAYRRERAFANAIETSPAFLATTLAAILAGGLPLAVNILTSVFLLSRLAMAYVHVKTENQPMRSAFFGVGWLCIILLAVTALVAVFF